MTCDDHVAVRPVSWIRFSVQRCRGAGEEEELAGREGNFRLSTEAKGVSQSQLMGASLKRELLKGERFPQEGVKKCFSNLSEKCRVSKVCQERELLEESAVFLSPWRKLLLRISRRWSPPREPREQMVQPSVNIWEGVEVAQKEL